MSSTNHDHLVFPRRAASKGELIIAQGREGDEAYLIQSGELSVFLSDDKGDIEVARLSAGDIVGEMALITHSKRAASVRAVTDCMLIVIKRDLFEIKLKASDPTIRALVRMLTKRMFDANSVLLDKKTTIDDFKHGVQTLYRRVLRQLPRDQSRLWEESVLPKIDALFDELRIFEEKFHLPKNQDITPTLVPSGSLFFSSQEDGSDDPES